MKSSAFKSLLALWSMLVLSGCIETSSVLQVNKDGSGTILVREFLSQEAISMLGGFEDMMGDMGAADDQEIEGLSDLPVFLQGMVRERAGEYGENVRLTAVRESTNDRGWKGYMARFEFDDINDVRLAAAMGPDEEEGASETEYEIQFTPGDVAELRLVPRATAAPATRDPAQDPAVMHEFEMDTVEVEAMDESDMNAFMDMDFDMDMDIDFGDMMEGMEGAMGDMFANMFKGMRMSMFIDVEGEIVETDAQHRSGTRPNRIALLDMNMDELMSHPDAMNLMMSNDPQAMYQLQEEGVPGLLMENPEKAITIRFR